MYSYYLSIEVGNVKQEWRNLDRNFEDQYGRARAILFHTRL